MNIPSLTTTLQRVFSSYSRTDFQTSPNSNKTDDMAVPQGFSSASAQIEGWDVFD